MLLSALLFCRCIPCRSLLSSIILLQAAPLHKDNKLEIHEQTPNSTLESTRVFNRLDASLYHK